MKTPSVAICIPTFNQAPYLEGAVRSALAQTHPCQVWVSDDASTDETPAVMARLRAEHPGIRHFRQAVNLGMSGNPRWVVQQPTTDFIVKLDSDDELHPGYVRRLLDQMMTRPFAGFGHVAVQEIDGAGRPGRRRSLGRGTGYQDAEESLRAGVRGYRVAANICMFRRAALAEVDYYRTDLRFADDWDLAIRLADAGWGNIYLNEVLAKYRVWDTSEQSRQRRKLQEVEGTRRVIEESLIPAFRRRAWSEGTVVRARRRMALRHAEALRLGLFTDAEETLLREALGRLGDSFLLRWKMRLIRTPLARLFALPRSVVIGVKTGIKLLFYRGEPQS
jgi:cellulose synthase/poly-beta-1,6-N-acetylglucosamine synthase-like glycosyltransferase